MPRSPITMLLAGLLVAGLAGAPARAALGGAHPFSAKSRPDLRSVSLDGSSARFCFDKSLARAALSPPAFVLGGYAAGTTSTAPTGVRYSDAPGGGLAQSCVVAQFAATPEELSTYSIGMIAEGAVTALNGGARSRADATALGGAETRSGARGHTVGPDLVGAIPDPAHGAVVLLYDQPVSGADPLGFSFYTGDGARYDAVSAAATGAAVRVGFSAGAPVGAADLVSTRAGAAFGTAGSTVLLGPAASSGVAGRAPATSRADLAEATYVPGGGYVDLSYDAEPLVAPPGGLDPAAFTGYLSDGSTVQATGATLAGAHVHVEFPNAAVLGEYLVRVAAREGAVRAGGSDSTAGGVPVGGNAGALASGFTTGPDALAVSFDRAAGTATVTFDQRVFVAAPAGFRLLDADGSDTGATASDTTIVSPRALGPTAVRVRFTSGQIAAARALELRGFAPGCPQGWCGEPAVQTALGGVAGANVQQILAPAP